jgi:hypothetical protein
MLPDQRVDVDVTIERGVDVASVVTDEGSGDPVAGVEVVLRRPGLQNVQAVAGFATTDAEGRFRFEYLPKALYTLALTHAGHQARQVKFDLAKEPWPERLALPRARAWTVELRGVPKEAAGEVVSWTLERHDQFEMVDGAMHRTGDRFSIDGSTALDEGGRLAIEAPPAGRWNLLLFESAVAPRAERTVEVPETGPVPPVVIPVEPRTGVAGTLVDAEGRPLPSVGIRIGSAASVRTDAAGRFEIRSVPVGSQPVLLRHGEANVTVGSLDVPASGLRDARVTVRGSAVIRGRVLIDDKPPASSWTTSITLRRTASRDAVARAHGDAYGKFSMPFLEPGAYTLVVFSGDVLPLGRTVRVAAGEVLDVGILRPALPRFPVRFHVPPGATLTAVGVVVQAANSPPDSGLLASVDVGGESWLISARVQRDDAGGAWLLGVPPGAWRLRFTADGFRESVVELSVRPGDVPSIDVRFERP